MKYKKNSKIGTGGFSRVFEVEEVLEREGEPLKFALKVVPKSKILNKEAKKKVLDVYMQMKKEFLDSEINQP